ncbi:MAG: LptF/LptG family permease [Litorimonas sp.]
MIGKTLYRYIAWHSFKAIAITFLVIIGIIMLIDFVEGSRNLDSDTQISALNLLYLTFLKAPKLIEQTLPFVVLFGIMGALYGMNRRSELIVIRAAGLSAWKFLRPILFVTISLGVLWSGLINPLSSKMSDQHDKLVGTWVPPSQNTTEQQIWLRGGNQDQQTVIFAKDINLNDKKIFSATFYIMDIEADQTTRFQRRFDAQSATLSPQGFWQLHNAIENTPRKSPITHEILSLPTSITLDTLSKQANKISNPSFWNIPKEIAENEAAGYSSRQLRLQFHKLLALPITLMAMTFIAAAVSMHLSREGGTIRLLITGATLGFFVYFADNIISAFGGSAAIPVLLAAWAIPLFTLFFGMSYLTRIEDG